MKHAGMMIMLGLLPMLLVGCTGAATPDPGHLNVVQQHRGGAKTGVVPSPFSDGPYAVWTSDTKKTITLTTYGSSSCPVIPAGLTIDDAAHLTLALKDYAGACTADLAPYTTVFVAPANISRTQPVRLTLHSTVQGTTDSQVKLDPNLTVPDIEAVTTDVATPKPAAVLG